MAALIEAEEAGDRLSEDELVAMVFLLLAAGHETTLHQIACSVLTLLDHPQQLAELTADWGLADSAAQELLRYVSFAQVSKPRYAREDTEFYGQPIRRGQMLFACLAAANSDPSVFDNPERLDIHRQPNRHLAFGAGIHVCLGAKLARVETAIALERLFTRFPRPPARRSPLPDPLLPPLRHPRPPCAAGEVVTGGRRREAPSPSRALRQVQPIPISGVSSTRAAASAQAIPQSTKIANVKA